MKTTGVRGSNGVLLVFACAAALASFADAQAADGTSVALSVGQAIEKAVETNLTTRLARAESSEARGRVLQAASALLPQLIGTASQQRVFKTNLAAEGFSSSPLIPNIVIGPYNVFDARLQLVQQILDLNSVWLAKEASANARAAGLGEELAGEQIASAAALAYIEDLRALRDVQDAQANWELARRLSTLAYHQHDAGLATAVDLARAARRASSATIA